MEISLLDGWLLKFICCSLHGAIWAINVEHVPTQIGGRCRSWACRQCLCLKVRLVKSRKDGKAPPYILGDMGRLIFSSLFDILQVPGITRTCLWGCTWATVQSGQLLWVPRLHPQWDVRCRQKYHWSRYRYKDLGEKVNSPGGHYSHWPPWFSASSFVRWES